MSQTIYIIRHGETDWNRQKRFQGHTDIALNDEGRLQAVRLAMKLADVLPFDRLVASDLLRARETAEILNRGYNTPIAVDEGLREMNFGQWEGLNITAIQERWPDELQEWYTSGQLAVPGGESQEELFQRVWQRFQYWADQEDYQKMGIVCHGAVCGVLICGVLDRPHCEMQKYMLANTGMYVVTVEGGGKYKLKVLP